MDGGSGTASTWKPPEVIKLRSSVSTGSELLSGVGESPERFSTAGASNPEQEDVEL